MDNWKDIIAVLILIKGEMEKNDKEKLWSYFLPNIAATEADIEIVEKKQGFLLDNQYKGFLKCANGWKAFYQSVDLFGTIELSDKAKIEYANSILNSIEISVLESSEVSRDELIPIAVTESDRDLFVITKPNARKPGRVIWYAGDEIDRFENFEEFFLAMIDYNREELKYLKGEE